MHNTFHPLPQGAVRLLPGMFQQRARVNRDYVVSLRSEALLQNFYVEAGLGQAIFRATSHGEPDPRYTGEGSVHGWPGDAGGALRR